jgi:hypothetical protein
MNQFAPEHPPGSFEPPTSSEAIEHKAMTRYEFRKVQPQKENAEGSTDWSLQSPIITRTRLRQTAMGLTGFM